MRISDWSSDVCSSDLHEHDRCSAVAARGSEVSPSGLLQDQLVERQIRDRPPEPEILLLQVLHPPGLVGLQTAILLAPAIIRSEEHTSELQSLMRISYAVFCLKTTTQHKTT